MAKRTTKRLLAWALPALLLPHACGFAPQAQRGTRETGGFFLVVAVKAEEARLAASVGRTMEVFRRRCEQLNLYCRAQRREGGAPNRIELRVSGAKDLARTKGVLLASGLELRALVSPPNPAPPLIYATRSRTS